MIIVLKNLPKISSNKIYAGKHWGFRKNIKDNYHYIIKDQFKRTLSDDKQYDVRYCFEFKKNPLDASNCSFMVKMIEDIIFKNDGYKVVRGIYMESRKGIEDKVTIEIKEIK